MLHPNAPVAPLGRKPRLHFLDSVRALAALLVVFGHIAQTVWYSNAGRFPAGRFGSLLFWVPHGHYAVAVFIVLSGYCLMLPPLKNQLQLRASAPDFYGRRAWRILPPYYAAMLASLALIAAAIGRPTHTLWDISIPVTWKSVVSHVLLVQNMTGTSSNISYPFWSIAVECQIYLFFPLLLLGWRRWGGWATTAAAVTLTAPTIPLLAHSPLNMLMVHFLGLFALGMFAAAVADGKMISFAPLLRHSRLITAAACAALVVLMGVFESRGLYFVGSHLTFMDLPVGLATATVLIAASRHDTALHRLLSWRPLAFLGTISYSLYLIHAPLVQLIWQYLIEPLRLTANEAFAAMVLLGIPAIVGVSYGFFRLFERPFMSSYPAGRKSAQKQLTTPLAADGAMPALASPMP